MLHRFLISFLVVQVLIILVRKYGDVTAIFRLMEDHERMSVNKIKELCGFAILSVISTTYQQQILFHYNHNRRYTSLAYLIVRFYRYIYNDDIAGRSVPLANKDSFTSILIICDLSKMQLQLDYL